MKVVGFTIIRNAIQNGYPVVEAINSVLPLCDKFLVSVGKSEDETLALINSINNPKIEIIESEWDLSLRRGGHVLAIETNKAFAQIPNDTDWCIYIQADEAIHEKDHRAIMEGMEQWNDNDNVDGLLFNYLHFYGSFDYLATSYRWYRREVRIIRKSNNIFSYRDAQGFRKDQNKKLDVKPVDASVYHYGWVRPPKKMQTKIKSFMSLYHSDDWLKRNISDQEEFDYSGIDLLEKFEETHPKVMLENIMAADWEFKFDFNKSHLSIKDKIKKIVEKSTGYRIGEFKNYRII